MLQIGELIDGKYKILNKVGQGGMSVVYLAMNEKANKQWAVKEVRKDGVKDFEIVKQGLVAEIDILKRLNHPNLPSIIDVIDKEDSFIIIMDYIQGNSLNKALDEYGAQQQEYVIAWAKQLCDVLGYLHSRTPAIIYRDMKPANIMLKPDGNVTLIDFGTAREYKEKNLADTTCLGTVGYAAPEQFGGMGQTDARTDIYCLGATLYHLVTGKNPCEPPYEILPIRQVNPSLSSGLERIIQKCTQRDPNDRYQSTAEMMYDLEHYDEIDDTHRKKQKRKLGTFISMLALSVVFAGVSIASSFLAEEKRGENYNYLLANAESVQNYYDTILLDPSRAEAYLGNDDNQGLINFLVNDGVLDPADGSALAKLKGGLDKKDSRGYITVVDVMEQLRTENPEGYKDTCHSLGEAYLFYYTVGVAKDKYATAATWFQHSQDRYPVDHVYCEIAQCLTDIAKYDKSGQHAKLSETYKNLWGRMEALYAEAKDFDEDLQIRVWGEIVNMILTNAEQFCEVENADSILDVLGKIQASTKNITNVFLKEDIAMLTKQVETAMRKIQTIPAKS